MSTSPIRDVRRNSLSDSVNMESVDSSLVPPRTPERFPDAQLSPVTAMPPTVYLPRHRPPHHQPVIGYGSLPVLLPPFDFPDFRRPRPPREVVAPAPSPSPAPSAVSSVVDSGPSLESKEEFPDLGSSFSRKIKRSSVNSPSCL